MQAKGKERNTYKYNSIDPKLGQFRHVEGRNYLGTYLCTVTAVLTLVPLCRTYILILIGMTALIKDQAFSRPASNNSSSLTSSRPYQPHNSLPRPCSPLIQRLQSQEEHHIITQLTHPHSLFSLHNVFRQRLLPLAPQPAPSPRLPPPQLRGEPSGDSRAGRAGRSPAHAIIQLVAAAGRPAVRGVEQPGRRGAAGRAATPLAGRGRHGDRGPAAAPPARGGQEAQRAAVRAAHEEPEAHWE